MATSVEDFKIASMAAGFTLGFGFLTVWTAIQQTMQLTNPWRSVYIYMVWGEILVNFIIAIIAWLFLDGVIQPSIVLYFFVLFLWVFEIQLLMQIIINRIAVVVEERQTAIRVKWIVAAIITCVNIAVFCIWIPAHLDPPVSELYVTINQYWDRTSKVIILIVDAGLNWYFLNTVRTRLVKYHGLKKYASLVRFNFRLMAVSISMDIMIIGLMSLPNPIVYVQFHPVAYIVKLNIEMSMAALITKIAIGGERTDFQAPLRSADHTAASYPPDASRRAHAHVHQLRTFSDRDTFAAGATGALALKQGLGEGGRGKMGDGILVRNEVVVDTRSLEDAYGSKGEADDDVPFRAAAAAEAVAGAGGPYYQKPGEEWVVGAGVPVEV